MNPAAAADLPMPDAFVTLVLGGARSGKSSFAERLVTSAPGPWTYVATAEARDDEMRERVAEHQARRDAGWTTADVPIELSATITNAGSAPVLIDCLTLWLSNLMERDLDLDAAFAALESALAKRAAVTVLVSSEVGLGIVPDNRLARRFRDAAGRLNQRIAARADRVVLMVAGLPLYAKGTP